MKRKGEAGEEELEKRVRMCSRQIVHHGWALWMTGKCFLSQANMTMSLFVFGGVGNLGIWKVVQVPSPSSVLVLFGSFGI